MPAADWLIREIEKAAKETNSWPGWMQDVRLWHADLAARKTHQSAESQKQTRIPRSTPQQRLPPGNPSPI